MLKESVSEADQVSQELLVVPCLVVQIETEVDHSADVVPEYVRPQNTCVLAVFFALLVFA